MADENNVELKLTADTKDATKSIDEFERSAAKSITGLSASFKSLGTVIAAAVAFVGAREVISFFQDSAKAAATNEAEVAKLEASLKSLGDFTPEVVEDFKAFADQLEANSTFSDDAAISVLALAKQLGLTNEEAKRLTQVSADLAAQSGVSLDTAFDKLSKTLKGTAGSLGTAFKEVNAMSNATLEAGGAVDFIEKRLSGFAKTAVNTYAGSLVQLENAQDDFRKSVGSIITQNPLLIEAIKAASEGFNGLTQFVQDNKETFSEMLSIFVELAVSAIPPMVDALGLVVTGLKLTSRALFFFTSQIADIISTILKFELVQDILSAVIDHVQARIGDLIAGFAALVKSIALIPGAAGVFKELGVDIEGLGVSLEQTANEFKDLSEQKTDFGGITQGLDEARDKTLQFGSSAEDAFVASEKGLEKFSDAASKAAKKIGEADSESAKSAKAAATAREVAGQEAIKAGNEVAAKKLKDLQDEKDHAKEREKLAQDAQNFLDRIFSKESSGLKKIEIERERDLKELKRLQKEGVIAITDAEDLRVAIIEDSEQKILDLRRKRLDEFKADLEAFANQARVITDGIAAGFGAIGDVLKGSAGAEAFVSKLSTTIGDAFIAGAGPAVSGIVDALAKGPAEVSKMIDEFTKALPQIIKNIADSIPVLIKALPALVKQIVEAIPQLVKSLAEIIPAILQEIIKALPKVVQAIVDAIPLIIKALADGIVSLVREIPKILQTILQAVPGIIKLVFKELPNIFKAIIQAIPGIITEVAKAIPDIIRGFVEGLSGFIKELPAIIDAFIDAIPEIVKGITDAIPDIITAIADAMPELVTALAEAAPEIAIALTKAMPEIAIALVDELVLKGGAIRIAEALIKGMFKIATLNAAGSNMFKGFSSGLSSAFTSVGNLFSGKVISSFGQATSKFVTGIYQAFVNAGTTFVNSLTEAFSKIGSELFSGISAAFTVVTDSIKSAFSGIFTDFKAGFDAIVALLKAPFDSIKEFFETGLTKPFETLKETLMKPINILIDFLNNFRFPEVKNPLDTSGKGGGGIGQVILDNVVLGPVGSLGKEVSKKTGIRFASGGVVPDGFRNDSFPARLTSKEMVLPPPIASGLIDLIGRGGRSDEEEANLAIITLLTRILSALDEPQQITTTAEVNGRAFADIILQLNRQNARLTA